MAKVDVSMPKMGESITEGTVIVWHKQPGDEVEQDETLLEIGTDKVDTEVPSPAAGVLDEILVEEGDTVEVGTIIARLETEAEAASEADAASPAPESSADDADAGASSDASEADTSTEAVAEPDTPSGNGAADEAATDSAPADEAAIEDMEVVMPKMGESITEGTIIAWFKDVGDPIDLDETLLEIGTDKVDTEVPSPAAGVLKERLVEEGDTVEVGTVIAIVGAEASAGAAADAPADSGDAAPASESEAPQPDPAPQPVADDGRPIARRGEDGQFFSPLVRSIAETEGLSMSELESIDGSGREGRVTKEDVLSYLETRTAPPEPTEAKPEPAADSGDTAPTRESAPAQPTPAPQAPASRAPQRGSYTVEAGPSEEELKQQYGDRIEVVEMDRMRKITAEHMVRSKATSAHVTSFAEADVTGLVKFRERHKEAFQEREGVKLTFTPFFVQAAVEALRDHPTLNASVEGDKIVQKKNYHIGIAVAIGQKGLLAPVIRNAGDLNVSGLARKMADTAKRARSKQLQPDELQGGTFTVTNIGSLGSLMGTPVINQPQVGILATGAIKKRPVVVEDPDMGDVIAVRHMMYLSLSYDHRVVDGALGSSFLHRCVEVLESYSADDEL
ncbi:2-oxoglutarate dehydrogenase, E2 component, dihydrolipoamide succinyltransferase [Longimonas halophila]|uniref:Dihydrolipoamide acetyltransferase component of pyruvate dehydrogenase complex n=1 Tax=Longimonas halophila TaxID=1469170 RepID=A0A2H3NUZ4_9BACT|nr:2-oxoglutarate dehydrogenase, E2 component, dihydrolipoamide succinyltransferase [Longimonas halophila]PEN05516.1 2-oxoglutarate dehydrogenase, E2 component, dihydrolipoamide succinyltransferase [Longimonas halophila]